MLLLACTSHPDIAEHFAHAHLGRLVQPRCYGRVRDTAEAGLPWAADNDAFVGFHEKRFRTMLGVIRGLPGCLFCAAPDVVADSRATLERFEEWGSVLRACGLPAALVLQDGITPQRVPWSQVDAVFVGGTTGFKLSEEAARVVAAARLRGLWCHMGRVNTARRIRYAASIGCHSCDGTQYVRWKRVHLQNGIRDAYHAREQQTRLVP
jgi:hypothetical protein